jgi:putative oxygen-independent coproporphyrinogen III oxidase
VRPATGPAPTVRPAAAASEPASLRTVAPADPAAVRSLYIHIPFCERRCEYCDFASVAGRRGEAAYVEALRAELRRLAAALPGTELDTVFLGGGTPGLIDPARLRAILDEVRAGFHLAPAAEVTIEANPSSTSEDRASAWRAAGCTRVSLGVQSLEPDVLRFLGRVHGPERALAAVEEVHRAGFERRSCDLIYAVPGLDDARWTATVERLLELDPGHLSCYELTVEAGTPLHRSVARGAVRPVAAEAALRQHWLAVDLAAAAGYRQYEVSNLARPGHECRHNLAYWDNRPYLAAGTGAHGHLPLPAARALGLVEAAVDSGHGGDAVAAVAVRYWHVRSPARFTALAQAGRLPVEGVELVGPRAHEAERVMVGLRRSAGVRLDHPASRRQAAALVPAGLLEWDGRTARATRRGQEVLNALVERLVDGL